MSHPCFFRIKKESKKKLAVCLVAPTKLHLEYQVCVEIVVKLVEDLLIKSRQILLKSVYMYDTKERTIASVISLSNLNCASSMPEMMRLLEEGAGRETSDGNARRNSQNGEFRETPRSELSLSVLSLSVCLLSVL